MQTEVVDTEHVRAEGQLISLHQLDSPSEEGACAGERALGERARARLETVIADAQEESFQKTGMACLQFMTCDGFVRADGADIGDLIIAKGLAVRTAVPEAGEPARDWCAAPGADALE